MKPIIFWAVSCGLVCCACLSARAEILESNLTHTFTVQSGGQLIMEVDQGSIELVPSDRLDLVVEVKRKIEGVSRAKAEQALADHQVSFDEDGSRVEVRAKSEEKTHSWFGGFRRSLQVSYRVQLPRQFDLDLQTAAGTIGCGDLQGKVKVRSSGGNLQFGKLQGSFEGRTSAGSVHLAGVTGPVSATSSGGNIFVGEADTNAVVVTSAGSIQVKVAQAELTAKTSGGNIDVGTVAGPADLETSAGSIAVKEAQGVLQAKSSGGNISIGQAHAAVQARTAAGSIEAGFADQPKGDCHLNTSGGNVQVKLAPSLAFDVDAKTSGGQVTSALPLTEMVTGKAPAASLQGKLNGGGPALVLRTSAGSIAVQKQ